jgi:hypothetical protein
LPNRTGKLFHSTDSFEQMRFVAAFLFWRYARNGEDLFTKKPIQNELGIATNTGVYRG